MVFFPYFPRVTGLAMYCLNTGSLIGSLRLMLMEEESVDLGRVHLERPVTHHFLWNSEGDSPPEDLFPPKGNDLPPFFQDFMNGFHGPLAATLDHLLRNHTGSQSSFVLLEWDPWQAPERNLQSAICSELSLGRYVPLRVLAQALGGLSSDLQRVARKRLEDAKLQKDEGHSGANEPLYSAA